MIDTVAKGRRSALAFAVVVWMMFALFTVCCCLDPDHVPAAGPLPAVQAGASHDVTVARDGGHSQQDCQGSVASVAVGSASVPGPLVVAVAGAPMAGQSTPWAGGPGPEASPLPPPVPHLLCVMRT